MNDTESIAGTARQLWLLGLVLINRTFMQDQAFEWDDDKAAENWRRHGVTFPQGAKATRDPFAVEWIDDREAYGEERVNLLGMCHGVILHITYVERGEGTRIISARRATKHEQDHYFGENAP